MKKNNLKDIYLAHRLYIFPAVVIFSSLILICFVIYPQISKLINNFQTEGQLNSKFEFLEGKAQALEGVDEEDLNNKLALALNIYPSDRDFSSVVGVLQDTISRFGFTIVSLHLGGNSDQSKASDSFYNINLEIMGPKSLLNSLVSGIETSPRIMKVSSVEMSNAMVKESVDLMLSVKVYYQTLPNTFGNTDSQLPTLSEKDETVLARLTRVQPSSQSAYPVARGKADPFE